MTQPAPRGREAAAHVSAARLVRAGDPAGTSEPRPERTGRGRRRTQPKPSWGSARSTLAVIALGTAVVVWALRDLALFVGYAVLLAYVLLPLVQAIERVRLPGGRVLPRGPVAAGVVLVLVTLAGAVVAITVPRLAAEASHFAAIAPGAFERIVTGLHDYAARRGLGAWLDPVIDGVRAEAPGMLQGLGGSLAQRAVGIFGAIGTLIGLALLPLLAFYLLAESDAVRSSALRMVPGEAHAVIRRLGRVVDLALRSYVRGQAMVSLLMGVAVGVGLALLHHPAALLLGLLVGVAELVPYIGFMIAAGAIALAGFSVSPQQAAYGFVLYAAVNWVMGTFVSPRLMGRYLRMHPFVLTVSVLAGAQLMGAGGALLAIPVAAMLQAVVGELGRDADAARRSTDPR